MTQLTEGADWKTSLLLHAPIGICILDAATLVAEMVNDTFLEVAGKPYHAIHGQSIRHALPEVWPYFKTALQQVVDTGEPYHANEVEMRLVRHGQEEQVYVSFVYYPVRNAEGRITKVGVWVLDNTMQVRVRQQMELLNKKLVRANEEQRAVNAALQATNNEWQQAQLDLIYANNQIAQNETLLQTAMDAAKMGGWHIRTDTNQVAYNPVLEQVFGYTGDGEMTYDAVFNQITPAYQRSVAQELQAAIENKGKYDITYPQ